MRVTTRPTLFKENILRSRPYVGGPTRGTVEAGRKLFKLSSNENPLGPSPLALRAIAGAMPSLNEYRFITDEAFTAKLAEKTGLAADRYLVANGGMELFDLLSRGFLSQGDSCLISSPCFMAAKNAAELAGATVRDVPLKENFDLDVDGMLANIDETTRVVFVSNPNNPTGSLFGEAAIRRLANGLPDHAVLVYDEVYHQYAAPENYVRAADLIAEGHAVIGLHSFSKAYGLAGIRLGYLFTQPEIRDYLGRITRSFMVNSLSMVAGMAALDDDGHIRRSVAHARREKEFLYEGFRKLRIRYWPSEANFILFESPDPRADLVGHMQDYGVMIRETSPMGLPGKYRVSIGKREANQCFLAALASA